jgi:hypothetical protein
MIRVRLAAIPGLLALAALAIPAVGRTANTDAWTPGPALYGRKTTTNLPVTMSDGTVLRADVTVPTVKATGEPATGPFPVILTQTPYGKTISGYLPALAGAANSYLVERGYIHVVSDIRGTGGSTGTWGPLDPIQGQDGAELVHWVAALPHSNGRVGTVGPSYLGFIQLMTAAAVGPNSPLKAIFPIVVGADLYRDVIFQGGIVDIEFASWYLPLMALANTGNPILEHRADPAVLPGTELAHAQGLNSFQVEMIRNVATGGDRAYDGEYWNERTPSTLIQRIVDNGIPAFLVGGWNDLFQRGTGLLYSGFQSAYVGRPVDAPMLPDQPVTGRYPLLMGPWFHVQYGDGLDLNPLELRWFDTWLKDADTGLASDSKPLHSIEMGTNRWVDTARFPYTEATPTTLYLGDAGALTPAAPTSAQGADRIAFVPVSNACTHSTQQWGAGALILAGGLPAPCDDTLPLPGAGPASLQYTTAPFETETTIAGPIGATLFATSTRPDAQFVLTLTDVAPNGDEKTLSSGALLGSFRALDDAKTWRTSDGRPFRAWHSYSQESVQPVEPGTITRFDIEVFSTFARLQHGHSLRLTITTSDTPHLLLTPHQLVNVIGGVYDVQRNAAASSFLEVPLAPSSAFSDVCELCAPAG